MTGGDDDARGARIRPQNRPDSNWPSGLDVDAVVAGGWTPVPFRNFVLKIFSRCDLDCDYCYMYRGPDQSWRDQPRAMSRAVVGWTARRISEHAAAHGLDRVGVVLHGGEPLLAGPDLIAHTITAVREAAGPRVRVDVSVQTNGTRLDDDYLALFARHGVRIGISLDGDRAAHDLHRRTADGHGSHARVTEALHRLSGGPHRALFGGLLCTIDLRNDPVGSYRELLRHRPPLVDFLLPHGNWTTPPPGRIPDDPATPYADWLAAVFDEWYGAPVRQTRVRVLEQILTLLLGGRAGPEGLGLEPTAYLVVETDGRIGQDDALRTAYPGAAATGLHVARDAFDTALRHPPFVARQLSAQALAAPCRACRLHRVCGGGHYVHRYRAGSGFANPSVYCPDLYALISHVRRRLTADIADLRTAGAGAA